MIEGMFGFHGVEHWKVHHLLPTEILTVLSHLETRNQRCAMISGDRSHDPIDRA